MKGKLFILPPDNREHFQTWRDAPQPSRVDRAAFRFIRRYWLDPNTPQDMVNAFTHTWLGTLQGQRLCLAIALRHLTRSILHFHK